MAERYQRKGAQRGEAEVLLFFTVLGVCGLISAIFWGFRYVRENKNGAAEKRLAVITARQTPAPFAPPLDAGEYYTTCERSPLKLLSKNTSCEILDESYREYEAMP